MHLSSFTRCLEIAVHNFRINSFSLVTDFNLISSNFTSLSFLKLVNELPFFLKRVAKVRLFSLPANFSALYLTFFSIFFSRNFQRFDFQCLIKKMAANLLVVRALSVYSCCKCQQEFPFRALTISDLSATSSKYQFLSLILCDTVINQKDIYIWKRKRHNCPRMLIEN